MGQFPPSPRVSHKNRFKFFAKIHEDMRKSSCTTGISTTTMVNFATSFASVVDTGGFIWKQYQAANVAH